MIRRASISALTVLVLAFGYVQARVNSAIAAPQAQDCSWSSDCGDGLCKVWDSERARFVCEPKKPQQYVMAVWDRTCLEKIELANNSLMEAPVGNDGKPDLAKARLLNAKATIAKGCQYRYDVRTLR